MIFVTVGTHEQQFNRLIQEVDQLKASKVIEEEVMIQTGYSTYKPIHCKWSKLISYSEMQENMKNARIVLTHGGPASFVAPLQMGKIPIVIPRQKKFEEHVNDHQLEFCRLVAKRMGTILLVEEIQDLEEMILNYEKKVSMIQGEIRSNNKAFNQSVEDIVDEMFKGGFR